VPTLNLEINIFNVLNPKGETYALSEGWLGFVYLGLFSQLFGFFFWYRDLALGGVARVSQVQLLQPFITILVSAAFLKEVVDVKILVSASLILMMVGVSRAMAVRR